MKFRDPKTGKVHEDIFSAHQAFCITKSIEECSKDHCPIGYHQNGKGENCAVYCAKYPAEAARLMGYEVIEDEPKRSCFNCWRYRDKNFPCTVPNIERLDVQHGRRRRTTWR